MIKPRKWYFQAAHFFIFLALAVALKKSHHFWEQYQLGTRHRIFQDQTSDWRTNGSVLCSQSHFVGFLSNPNTHHLRLFVISFQVIGFSKTNCCCSCSRYFSKNFVEFMCFSYNWFSNEVLGFCSFFKELFRVLMPSSYTFWSTHLFPKF
jgi:hypothetical protein